MTNTDFFSMSPQHFQLERNSYYPTSWGVRGGYIRFDVGTVGPPDTNVPPKVYAIQCNNTNQPLARLELDASFGLSGGLTEAQKLSIAEFFPHSKTHQGDDPELHRRVVCLKNQLDTDPITIRRSPSLSVHCVKTAPSCWRQRYQRGPT